MNNKSSMPSVRKYVSLAASIPKQGPRLLVLDYDRTMIAHNYPDWYQGNTDYYTDCLHMLTNSDMLFAGDKPVPAVVWYSRYCFERGWKILCVTHETSNLRDGRKLEMICKYYGEMGIEYYTVDTAEHKIPFIKAYAAANKIPLRNVTLIEDSMSTVNLAVASGIHAVHLSSVVVKYEMEVAEDEDANSN